MSSIRCLAAVSALLAPPLVLMGCGTAPAPTFGECEHILKGTPKDSSDDVPSLAEYDKALKDLNMAELEADMKQLLAESKDCWPADFGNYGPFMIRLAWHCAGTYRNTDSRGGCGGGLQRFEPEASWPDNTNLDKARALVYPLKLKYGAALSWGDLFILAGSQALKDSGAPISRICYGRVDEADGSRSMELNKPCDNQGDCSAPHGTKEVGLIYVNPGGHIGDEGNPKTLVKDIRDTFGRMGANDRATVALIGGGHTLGKSHGACKEGAGKPPKDAFRDGEHIWKGGCGDGKGSNTVTSGFEGQWTSKPLEWDNQFFTELKDKTWALEKKEDATGVGQVWKAEGTENIRLTSDMALLEDTEYEKIVNDFAASQDNFNKAFDEAWDDLTIKRVGAAHAGKWSKEAKCNDNKPLNPEFMRMDDGPQFVV